MKTNKLILMLAALSLSATLCAQNRGVVALPDIPGYRTLKCDFHIHTIFSDGMVHPSIRVDEAFLEGLDAIAIADHIEYRPHIKSGWLVGDHNQSYKLAAGNGKARSGEVILIKGAEITRGMPPGHWCALFVKDCNPLDTPDYTDAIRTANEQGGLTIWNHPGWERQAPDTTRWLDEHTKLHEAGYMAGLEVANTNHYFPEAFQWALDKNLAMFGNSDIHQTDNLTIDFERGEHRTMTLVFAKERSEKGIREAIDNRRTAVYYRDRIIGREEFVRPLFNECVRILEVARTPKEIRIVMENVSEVPVYFSKGKGYDWNLSYFQDMCLKAHSRGAFTVTFKEPTDKAVTVDIAADNFMVGPDKGLHIAITVPALKEKK